MKLWFIFGLIFISNSAICQNRANIWELSYSPSLLDPNSEMRYVNGLMDTNKVLRSMAIQQTNTSICDTTGNLLFYSNGLYIGNHNYDTLKNSVNFNLGWANQFDEPEGMTMFQSVLMLPYPGAESSIYLIFSVTRELIIGDAQPLHLSYSVIDLNLDGGLGGIVDTLKNKYAIEDTLNNGGITAVKHANGRDWWVIIPKYHSNIYYRILITPNEIYGPYFQSIGSVITQDIVVQAVFSPDGSKYCFSSASGKFEYMQFDRCTGELSNSLTVYNKDSLGFLGCSFSPNSRFLYLSDYFNLYQYDTWDSNMIDDVIKVAEWDSFVNPIYHIPVLFSAQQLAPDSKIYIAGWNGTEFFNVINSPDSLGFACNFQPHSYVLAQYNNSIPSFPNYDLGALQGSSCDTILNISTNLHTVSSPTFRISPNPATIWLNIVYQTNEDASFGLFDINGKQVAAGSLYHYFRNRLFDVSSLPAGIYFVTVTQIGRQIWSKKVVLVH